MRSKVMIFRNKFTEAMCQMDVTIEQKKRSTINEDKILTETMYCMDVNIEQKMRDNIHEDEQIKSSYALDTCKIYIKNKRSTIHED